MKRIFSLFLALILLFSTVPALASSSSINSIISLMTTALPEEDDSTKVYLYYNSKADIVVLEWTMKEVSSDAYLPMASALQNTTADIFDDIRGISESMKEILEISGFEHSALAIILTNDGVPIATFCNGADIHIVK